MNLPAGPRFPALQTLKIARDTKRFFLDAARRYGDPFTLPLAIGDVVVTGDPEGIREIFSADPALFTPFAVLPLEPVVGRHSVLLLDGAHHRRERKLLTPPFHGDRMRAYGELDGGHLAPQGRRGSRRAPRSRRRISPRTSRSR